MIVVLVGYMASGKSTLGKILAQKLKYDFMDLDNFLESIEQATITNIFKDKGEIYFRKLEASGLKELIRTKKDIVLSLGGGTPCYGENMIFLNDTNNVTTVYLKASIPTLVSRLENENDSRPLIAHLNSDEALSEFIGKHLFERSYYYNQAHIIIETDNKTHLEIIEDIILELF